MPRKKPVTPRPAEVPVATLEPQQIVQQVADSFVMPGDAAEPATSANTDFAPHEPQQVADKRNHVWARIDGYADKPVGIKVETESERQPGIAHTRVLIRFRSDCLPTPDEKALLKAEGFKYCTDAAAWGQQKSAAALVLAKRVVSDLAKGRGDEGQALYI